MKAKEALVFSGHMVTPALVEHETSRSPGISDPRSLLLRSRRT